MKLADRPRFIRSNFLLAGRVRGGGSPHVLNRMFIKRLPMQMFYKHILLDKWEIIWYLYIIVKR